jgi:DMSO/TMAO reductase YedYZ heme-binding membrane subunit
MTAVWFTARGAGLSALVLLTISTCLGALISGRGPAGARAVAQHVHRVVASLGLGVLVLHVVTILADSYANVGVSGAIIPFTSGYRTTWVGLGTIAAYVFLLVAALGFARVRMASTRRGAAVWRALHGLAYAGWGLAMLHGFMSGTDTPVGWVQLLYALCGGAVLGSIVARLISGTRPELVRATAVRGTAVRGTAVRGPAVPGPAVPGPAVPGPAVPAGQNR